MKKILLLALSAMLTLSMAGCGSGKPTNPANPGNAPAPKPPMEGAMVIPENWDGITFTSTDGKIKIVAPEEGWTCTNDTDSSVMLSKDDDGISCIIAKEDEKTKFKRTEEDIKATLTKHNKLVEFNYENADDGTITYEYVIEMGENTGMDAVRYSKNTIEGDTKTEVTAITKKGNDARFKELRGLAETNVTVSK